MKFDDQLAAYLYQARTLTLEGIGTFKLDEKVSVPGAQEREVYYPIEGLSFIYNPRSRSDEDLVSFLVQQLHKIEPLIRSDLESYLSTIKQFINLGKPYTIAGIGTLSKNNQGTYEFTPGNFLPAKEELNPHRENADHNYPVRSRSSAGRVFVIIIIALAVTALLGSIGWGISTFIGRFQQPKPVEEVQNERISDTLPDPTSGEVIQMPSAVSKSITAGTTNATDSVFYKMVFETTRLKERAEKRTVQLNALGSDTKVDTVRSGNSLQYKLYLPVAISKSDTTRLKRIRDSLRIFFGGRIISERQ